MSPATISSAGLAAFQRGLAAQQAERSDEAIAAYRDAIARAPELAAAHFNLGQLLRKRNAIAEAAECFEHATRLRPGAPDGWLNHGVCRERLGDLDTAVVCYTEVLRLDPKSATAHFNLGNVRKKQGDLIAALHEYHQAASLLPHSPEIELNIGTTLREAGQLEAATVALERAASLNPEWAEPRVNLAVTELSSGDLARGWENYEWRWAQIGLAPERGYPWPVWRGEPLAGRSILVWREQGLGDELLFSTCIPDLVERGAEVTLTTDPRLVSLLGRAFPSVRVIADPAPRDRTFDFHTPIGSLPRYVRPTRASFKPSWSILVPDRTQQSRWRDRMAALPPGLRIGICWRSGLFTHDRRRHYSRLSEWRALFEIEDAVWINLQYDDCEDELLAAEAEFGIRIQRWPAVDLKNDLEAVAALIWHLDVVVTAPTAVSSLAGLVGIDTWELDTGADWTAFGEHRSPWLPAIRLARRAPSTPDWEPVIRTVAADLRERLASRHDQALGTQRSG
jgi:Tfp pilus assembly protein PilF